MAVFSVSCVARTPNPILDSQSLLDNKTPSATSTNMPTYTATSIPSPTITPTPTVTPTQTNTPTPDLPIGLATPFPFEPQIIDKSNIQNIQKLAHFGGSILRDVLFSEDGEVFAAVFKTGIEVFKRGSSSPHSRIDTGISTDNYYCDYALSPDGFYFAVVTNTKIEVWDTRTSSLLKELIFTEERIRPTVEFSPNSSFLVVIGDNFYLIDISKGKILTQQENLYLFDFSPDNKYLAVSGGANTNDIKILSTDDGGEVFTLGGPRSPRELAFSPDGKTLSVGYAKSIWVWDYQKKEILHNLPGSNEYFRALKYSSDGSALIAEAHEHFRIWDLIDGKLLLTMSGQTDPVLSPEKSRLVTRNVIRYDEVEYFLWDLESKAQLAKISGERNTAGKPVAHFVEDQNKVNIFIDGYLALQLNSSDGTKQKELFTSSIYRINPPSKQIATFSRGDFDIRDLDTGEIITSIELPDKNGWVKFNEAYNDGLLSTWEEEINGTIYEYMFSVMGFTRSDPAISVKDSEVIIYDQYDDGRVNYDKINFMVPIGGLDPQFVIVQISGNQQFLAVKDKGNRLTVWDIEEEVKVNSLTAEGGILDFVFSSENDVIYYNYTIGRSINEVVKEWNFKEDYSRFITQHRTEYKDPNGGGQICHDRPIAISNNNKFLAVSGENCTIQILSPENLQKICNFFPPPVFRAKMEFSPNGEVLATGFSGGEVQFWDSSDCSLLMTIEDHQDLEANRVNVSFAFSPSGKFFGTAHETITLWGIEP